jgi:hypothetical protein
MREGSTTSIPTDQFGPDVFDPLDLEQILHGWLSDAFVLAQYGHDHDAGIIAALVTDVEIATCLYLDWLTDEQAIKEAGVTSTQLDAIHKALREQPWSDARTAEENSARASSRSLARA